MVTEFEQYVQPFYHIMTGRQTETDGRTSYDSIPRCA